MIIRQLNSIKAGTWPSANNGAAGGATAKEDGSVMRTGREDVVATLERGNNLKPWGFGSARGIIMGWWKGLCEADGLEAGRKEADRLQAEVDKGHDKQTDSDVELAWRKEDADDRAVYDSVKEGEEEMDEGEKALDDDPAVCKGVKEGEEELDARQSTVAPQAEAVCGKQRRKNQLEEMEDRKGKRQKDTDANREQAPVALNRKIQAPLPPIPRLNSNKLALKKQPT